MSFRTLSYEKIMKYLIYSYIPCSHAQVLSKMQCFLIRTLELQNILFMRKELTLIYICDTMFFSNWNIYQKLYINNENLVFSMSQHKITGKLCGLGKNWRQHRVKDAIVLQNMLKFWKFSDKKYFFWPV